MVSKKQELQDKKKKMKWVQILAPKEFNNVEVGETYIEEPINSVGKTLTVNLMVLTRDPKKQSNNITFKVTEFKNNALQTEILNLNMQTAQLKRTTRKDKTKIEDSFVVVTKDNIKLKFKPILLTKAIAHKSILTALRKSTREVVSKVGKESTFSQFIKDIVSGQTQKIIKNENKKVYPLASCTIKRIERLN